ncbi:MAG: cell division protein SepF [Candidatus Margulisbacteria bacterium]|nr:cell division protein SepF [Candidatus Margulisiibacteriota bacterium]MBU1021314.1 cell division protein SepF [Candidatus Margulisiibacteriota bacterium]MBU1729197.1 cell division protein SepF [Candidatus Margulisiibacteriota bacterium]MBU1954870.1 cell division protein SepF [Candidatus Margulisiibacteriota bacterium]
MGDGIFSRAKAFIGLEEAGEEDFGQAKQMDLSSVLRSTEKRGKQREGLDYEMILFEPKIYEDSLNISTQLRSGNPVIINLKHLEQNEGTRLVDFVCGTAYAIDGHMTKIGETIFLFTPSNIGVVDTEERSAVVPTGATEERTQDTFFSR